MTEFRWVGDGEQQELFAGCNDTPLAWLCKRKKWWSAAVWVPGIEPRKEYDVLENHKADIEAKFERWFALASMGLPAMDRDE